MVSSGIIEMIHLSAYVKMAMVFFSFVGIYSTAFIIYRGSFGAHSSFFNYSLPINWYRRKLAMEIFCFNLVQYSVYEFVDKLSINRGVHEISHPLDDDR